MKQENRFVADLYHYLSPFIDRGKDIFFCLDGGAAKHHAQNGSGTLSDSVLPDLWFSLIGHDGKVGIEAKIIEGNTMSFRQGQIQSWKSNGTGSYRPNFWVAANRDLSEFHCWHHTRMAPRLDSTESTVDNVSLSMAHYPADFVTSHIQSLALYILQNCGK